MTKHKGSGSGSGLLVGKQPAPNASSLVINRGSSSGRLEIQARHFNYMIYFSLPSASYFPSFFASFICLIQMFACQHTSRQSTTFYSCSCSCYPFNCNAAAPEIATSFHVFFSSKSLNHSFCLFSLFSFVLSYFFFGSHFAG